MARGLAAAQSVHLLRAPRSLKLAAGAIRAARVAASKGDCSAAMGRILVGRGALAKASLDIESMNGGPRGRVLDRRWATLTAQLTKVVEGFHTTCLRNGRQNGR